MLIRRGILDFQIALFHIFIEKKGELKMVAHSIQGPRAPIKHVKPRSRVEAK